MSAGQGASAGGPGAIAADGGVPGVPGAREDVASQSYRTAVVRFRTPGQAREYSAGDLALSPAALVVVETDRGTRIGTVVDLRAQGTSEAGHRVLRVVSDEDLEIHNRNKVREREAFSFCVERIRALGLPMKLVGVELAHSGSSAVFSFTSSERVDFRALVKDLARRFHTRIDMRQIGVRDASRLCGGTAVCGRDLCCATWLPSFAPISVRMAKDQNLALNQEKLSGACGRLKCCLAFEEEAYAELRKGLPKIGKRVLTPAGEGRVKDVNVIKRLVRVQLVDGRYQEYHGDEVQRPPDAPAPQPLPAPPADTGGDGEQRGARPEGEIATVAGDGGRRRRRRRKRRNDTGSPPPASGGPDAGVEGDPSSPGPSRDRGGTPSGKAPSG